MLCAQMTATRPKTPRKNKSAGRPIGAHIWIFHNRLGASQAGTARDNKGLQLGLRPKPFNPKKNRSPRETGN